MPSFFSKHSNMLVENERILSSYQAKKILFNPEDMLHEKLISDCTQNVEYKLNELMLIDQKITTGFAVGIAAFALSWFLPFGIIAISGFSYGSYQLGQRQQAYAEYSAALENLVNVSNWSLNNVTGKPEAIKTNVTVRSMIEVLAPLLTTKQLCNLIHPSLQAEFIEQADKIREKIALFGEKQGTTELYYNIYGYKQGGFLAILQGIGYIIQEAFTSVKNLFTGDTTLVPESSARTTLI